MESFHWDNLLKCIELVWNWKIHKPSDHFYCPRPNYNACLPTNKNDKNFVTYMSHYAALNHCTGEFSGGWAEFHVDWGEYAWDSCSFNEEFWNEEFLGWSTRTTFSIHSPNIYIVYVCSMNFIRKKIECLGLIVNNQALRTVHLLLLLQ